MPLAFLAGPTLWPLGLWRTRSGRSPDRKPFMSAPCLLPGAGGLPRLLDGRVHHFALAGREGTSGHLPLTLLVRESVTDLQLQGQHHDTLSGSW